jgi:tRNA nucleotidyltransferase (CCA-adding enzyme)
LTALRASNGDIAFVVAVSDAWVNTGDELARIATVPSPDAVALRRIIATIGRTRVHGTLRSFAAVWAARRASGQPAPAQREVMRLARRMLRMAFTDPIALGDLALTGDDLRGAGVQPGPALGRILHALLDRVLDDPALNTHDRLLALASTLAQES